MMEISQEKKDKIERYLAEDIEDLIKHLGSPEVFKSTEYRYVPGEEYEMGLKVLASIKDKLYQAICIEWKFCEKIKDPKFNEDVNLVAILMDVVSSVVVGFPPILITTILVKRGLNKFCDCKKEASQEL
jgi:hypothetical protein